MEKKTMVGVAALALIAVAAMSVVGTFAYPGMMAAATGSASGDCDGDRLQTRLQTHERTCDVNGTMTCEMSQIRTQAQICDNPGVDCNWTQTRLMQQSQECLSLGEQTQSAIQARNQIMTRTGNSRS